MMKLLTAIFLAAILAAPVTKADPLPYSATLTVEFAPMRLGPAGVFTLSASGMLSASVTAGSQINSFSVPPGIFSLTKNPTGSITSGTILGVPKVGNPGVSLSNGSGVFLPSFGFMPVRARMTFCLFLACPIILGTLKGTPGTSGPTTTASFGSFGLGSIGNAIFVAGTVTAGTGSFLAIATLTRMAAPNSTFTTSGSGLPSSPIVKHSVFNYVAPSTAFVGGLDAVATFATLRIDIQHPIGHVPEPGSLLLIGAGFAGLALAGRRRGQRG